MKCKDCIHFLGVVCHGHGEYWGECDLLRELFQAVKIATKCDYISTGFRDVVYDETECIILKKFGFEVRFIH